MCQLATYQMLAVHAQLCKRNLYIAVQLTCTSVELATHSKGNTMHSSVDVRQMILLPSSRSATMQTPSTGDNGLQQHTDCRQPSNQTVTIIQQILIYHT